MKTLKLNKLANTGKTIKKKQMTKYPLKQNLKKKKKKKKR